MLEIYKRVCRPKRLLNFLARHNFSRPLEQHHQNLRRLIAQSRLAFAVLAQLARQAIKLKHAEAKLAALARGLRQVSNSNKSPTSKRKSPRKPLQIFDLSNETGMRKKDPQCIEANPRQWHS